VPTFSCLALGELSNPSPLSTTGYARHNPSPPPPTWPKLCRTFLFTIHPPEDGPFLLASLGSAPMPSFLHPPPPILPPARGPPPPPPLGFPAPATPWDGVISPLNPVCSSSLTLVLWLNLHLAALSPPLFLALFFSRSVAPSSPLFLSFFRSSSRRNRFPILAVVSG